jgi:hypothetical protein
MVSIPKVISVMSCGVLLCLGLSNAAQADNAASVQDEMKADQSDRRQGGQVIGEKTIEMMLRSCSMMPPRAFISGRPHGRATTILA